FRSQHLKSLIADSFPIYRARKVLTLAVASVITPKAATGQVFGTRVSSRSGKRLLAFLISVSNDCLRRTWWEVWKAFCAFQVACGNREEKAAAGHRRRFPQLRYSPQVVRLWGVLCIFGVGVGQNVRPGSSINDDRHHDRLQARRFFIPSPQAWATELWC